MATSFKNIFDGINALCRDNKMEINGQTMEVELFLGEEMKVTSISNYICACAHMCMCACVCVVCVRACMYT